MWWVRNSMPTRGPVVAALMFLWMFAGCAAVQSLSGGGKHQHPYVSSFLGVSFGEALDDVQMKYPTGDPETSPYGAPAYRVTSVSGGLVHYTSVVYEFQHGAGMQLIYAKFDPGSAADLLKVLKDDLGEPVSTRTGTGQEHDTVEASWVLPKGESVEYDSGLSRLAILGPEGGPLKDDIRMRDEVE